MRSLEKATQNLRTDNNRLLGMRVSEERKILQDLLKQHIGDHEIHPLGESLNFIFYSIHLLMKHMFPHLINSEIRPVSGITRNHM